MRMRKRKRKPEKKGAVRSSTSSQLSLPGMPMPDGAPARKPGLLARSRRALVSTPMTRRRFLTGTLGWVSAAIGSALGIPAAVAVISPALSKSDRGWSPVARLGPPESGMPDLTVIGEPVLTSFRSLVEDAYLKASPRDVAIFVINNGDGEFTIFDDRCTHLGCPFNWDDAKKEFNCPCHNGIFDAEGRVTGGPPPRPLDRYEFKIEDDVLFVGKLYEVNADLERVTK
jgi:menaquinol-cytochrome c reductase iron-sulfur subunit